MIVLRWADRCWLAKLLLYDLKANAGQFCSTEIRVHIRFGSDKMLMYRDNLFYPSWAFALPITLLRLPYSFIESLVWSGLVYYVAGLDANPGR